MRVSRSEELTTRSNTTRNTLCYTPHVAKKAKLMRAYRLPEHIIREIERLAEEWECTHADVIERAIERVGDASGSRWKHWGRGSQTSNGKVSELKVEYDE